RVWWRRTCASGTRRCAPGTRSCPRISTAASGSSRSTEPATVRKPPSSADVVPIDGSVVMTSMHDEAADRRTLPIAVLLALTTLLAYWHVVLLLLLLVRSTGALWPSAAVAALFALHPLRVESVAWVAERKDLLCGLFALTTIWAYVRYAERPRPGRYALVALSLALGLMAKPMLVTLPLVLLLLDRWPLRRGTSLRLVVEKLPLLALAAAAGVMEMVAAQRAGAV